MWHGQVPGFEGGFEGQQESSTTKGNGGKGDKRAQLLASLEEEISLEDPFCGEAVIRQITRPFIEAQEQDAIRSWRV